MFVVNDDLSIYATRGDIVCLNVSATDDSTGGQYEFQPGDIVRMKIFGKKDAESIYLSKDFPVVAKTYAVGVLLTEEDTKIGDVISKPTDYWYEIELNPYTNPQTIVGYDEDGAKVFKLFPEGKDIPDEPVEPEVVALVDKDLDLTSSRPVENRAIARAVTLLKNDLETVDKRLTGKIRENKDTSKELNEAILVERARIDNLLSGATADGSEVVDVRVGANSFVYDSAGSAVRDQVKTLKGGLLNVANDVQTLWVHGTFLSATLQTGTLNTNYKYRVSSEVLISFAKDTVLYIADDFRLAIHEFQDNSFYADWGWRTGSVEVKAGVTFKCMIARVTENTEEVADVLEFTNAITLDTMLTERTNEIRQSLYASENVKARYVFEPGDIKADTGRDTSVNLHRIRTRGVCYTPDEIVLVGNGTCRVYLYTFGGENYANPVAMGWVMTGNNAYTIPAGTYFRLLVGHLDDSTVAYDEVADVKTSDLYRGLEIYTSMHHKRSLVNKSKSNILSVAHQGCSTTEQYFGNCRVSAVHGAYMNGFDHSEIDIQFASDGVPVCCHDATFTDTHDNATVVTIAHHTASELKAYGYYGETIATFEEIVAECKRLGIGLYIDKVSNIDTDDKWQIVFGIIKKYGMADHVTWLGYNSKISEWNKKARFAIVVHELNDGYIDYATNIASVGHEVFLNVNCETCTVDQIIAYNAKLPAGVNIGVWTIDDMATYEAYKPYVCAITSNKISDAMTDKG